VGVDGFLNSMTTSEELLIEAIRQKCIYKITHEAEHKYHIKNQQMIYWNYMKLFHDQCIVPKDFHLSCSKRIINELEQTNKGQELTDYVENCQLESFTFNHTSSETENKYLKCEKNLILEEDSMLVENRLKAALPIIYVNQNPFYGAWTYENVLEAMCANLKDKPSSCYKELDEIFKHDTYLGLTLAQFIFLICCLMLFNVILIFYCKRLVQRKIENKIGSKDINEKISEIVQHYIALKEVKQ